ncbi:hypothetical protein VNI00_003654 [Paramarasmius palmivorus]|uniref:Uncharacterized protein n=1 Tax=Paramarasmius palmivorus TaxID=297713 RepID=A0AAW0DU37_9AGAR
MPMPRHRVAFLSILFFLQTSQAALGSDITCEAAARRLGQPVDGWRAVKIRNPEHGQVGTERCVRKIANITCQAPDILYYNPETRVAECCKGDGSITWQDEEAKLGFCCAADHHWSGNILDGEGGCCPIGMNMVDGMCAPHTEDKKEAAPGGCGCHSSRSLNEPVEPIVEAPKAVEDIPDGNETITDTGLFYGHCYTLSLPDGREVGSNRENAIYTPGGLFQNIPFRMGKHNDPNGTMGWVAGTLRGVLKIMFTADADDAFAFTAKRNTSCSDNDRPCGLLLRGSPVELVFNETDCWVDDSGHTSFDRDRDEL